MLQQPGVSNKIDWRIINALRGLAALYVVIHHSRHKLFTDAMEYARLVNPKESWNWLEWLNILLLQHCNLGVEFVILFFVLSGFSIAHSLQSHPDLMGFYKRRLLRLYPTYAIGILWALVVFLFIMFVAPDVFYKETETVKPLQVYFTEFLQPLNILKNLLYIPNNNLLIMQYWSLPLEVIFYLIAPFAIKKFRWYGIITMALYLAGWALYGMAYNNIRNSNVPFQFTFDYGIYFLAGMIFYKYKDRLIKSFPLNSAMVFIVLFAIFEILVTLKSYVWHQVENKYTGMFMILFSYVILFGFLKHAVRIKWLEKIGVYSYTLYVTHVASIHIISAISYNMGTGFYYIQSLYLWYFGIAISLIFAYLLYWVAERPSTRYLEKLRQKLQ